MPTSPSFSPLLLPITAPPSLSTSQILYSLHPSCCSKVIRAELGSSKRASGGDSRKHSEEGTGWEGGKPWRVNQRAGHTAGSALLGTLWGGIRMCLSLSLGGNLGIYPLTPIFPWLRAAPGLFILWMPISGLPCPCLAKPPGYWRTPRWRDRGKQGWAGSGHCTGYHPAQVHVSPELVQGTWGRISRAPATAIISLLEDHPSLSHSSAINHVPLTHPLRLLESLPTGKLAGEDS